MKHALPLLILICLGLPATGAQVSRPSAPTAAARYRISGKVVNGISDQALSEATISIYQPGDNRLISQIKTTDDGRFTFDQLAPGKYVLQGDHRGFIAAMYDEHDGFSTAIVVGPGLESENLILRLTPFALISGVVTDEAGEPVRGARLSLYSRDPNEGLGNIRLISSSMTDDTGAYELPHLKPGNYFLAVMASPWYANHPSILQASAQDNGARSPLDVAYPTIFYADANDSDSATPIPVKGGDALEINFNLQAVPALHLFIHEPQQRPAADATLQNATPNAPQAMQATVQQSIFGNIEGVQQTSTAYAGNEAGITEIAGLAPGHYQVQISGTPDSPSRTLTVDATSDAQLDSSAGATLSEISGTVEGAPQLAAGEQTLIGLTQPGKQDYQPVGKDGTFRFQDLLPGSYEVVAQGSHRVLSIAHLAASNATVAGNGIKLTGGEANVTLTVTIAEGSSTLQGVARKGDKPFGGAMIVLVPKDPASSRSLFRRDQSDSDGTFALANVPAGTYTVVAIQDGWVLDWADPEVIARYVPKGLPVTIPSSAAKNLKLAGPVDVQPRF